MVGCFFFFRIFVWRSVWFKGTFLKSWAAATRCHSSAYRGKNDKERRHLKRQDLSWQLRDKQLRKSKTSEKKRAISSLHISSLKDLLSFVVHVFLLCAMFFRVVTLYCKSQQTWNLVREREGCGICLSARRASARVFLRSSHRAKNPALFLLLQEALS